jgi:putative ABC transport system permease protein
MFRPIILRLGLRHVNRRLFQSLLFILGVALGVAVVIAIDLANGSASRAFALSTQSVTGKATHQIIGGGQGIPTAIYRTVRVDLGIRDSAPIISESVRSDALGGQPLRLLGVDPFAEPPFRDYLTSVQVLTENGGSAFEAVQNFIAQPNTVLISQTLATRYGVQAGDSIPLQTGASVQDVRVIGLLQPDDDLSRQALDDLVIADIATAQELTQQANRLTRIDLILPYDYDTTQITALLPQGAVLVPASSAGNALEQMTAAFEINLQALSLLAVVVGVFLIYNTVTFSVVQRRPQIGIMRSLGATKAQIFAIVIGEAFVLGLIGTVLGMGLGIIFGRFTVGLVAQTISDLYFNINVTSITVDPFTLVKGAALGLAASLGAAFIPSVDATRTAPAGSMKRSSFEEQIVRLVPLITLMAIVFLGLGYALLQIPTTNLFVSFGALFCVIFGGALFVPIALIYGMRLFTPLTSALFGIIGRLAPRAVTRSLSRTSVAVAALTIAVSVIVGVSAMISSFRNTVSDWLDTTIGADIFVSSPLLTSNQSTVDVDPAIRQLVSSVAGVERVSAARTITALAPDYPDLLPVNLTAVDFDISKERGFVWNDAPNGDHKTALESGDNIIVSEPFAFRRNITRENNTLRLETDAGIRTFTVIGVYYDYSTDQGNVVIYRNIYDHYWNDPFISQLAAFIQPDADLNAIIETLKTQTLVGYDLQVQSNRTLRTGVFEIFERTFTITIALRLLATLVAFIGILSALMSLQLEQTREYGVMRANGMSTGQLWRYTLLQTGLMGTTAGVLALPIGFVLALVLIYVINVRSFGWTMQFSLAPSEFVGAFAVAVVASLLAGIYPSYQLAKLLPSQALRSE